MKIRLEQEQDYREVENLIREAFWNVYRPGCMEHLVLHRLRQEECFIPELDYVLEEDGRIAANIVYAKGTLTAEDGTKTPMLMFGPVGVLPECQGKGYGTKLITYTLELAAKLGYPAVAITGNPDYYSRFGFESASGHGIYYEGLDQSEEAPFFMVKILDASKALSLKGTYSDPACFFVDEKEVEAFDRSFPPKEKKDPILASCRFCKTDGENEDFAALCEALDRALDQAVGGKIQRQQYAKYNLRDSIHDVILIYREGRAVGCGAYKLYDEETVELKRIYVDSSLQGRGIGKELVRRLEADAKKAGYRYAVLETGAPLIRAAKLYQGLGYERIPNYGQYADMPDSICMKKKL